MKSTLTTTRNSHRAAFSLIELLVVITILTILMGLAYVTLGQSGQKARVAATQTTLAQLDAVLQADFRDMLQDFTEQERKAAAKAEWENLVAGRAALTTLSYPGTQSQLNAMVRQNRYLGLFPQRWEDTYGFNGAPGGANPAFTTIPDDSTQQAASPIGAGPLEKRLTAALAKLPANPPKSYNDLVAEMTSPSPPATNKNSELLYLLLTGSPNGTNLLDQIDADHIGDTDGDGFPEFLDDWGTPIRFYNTPTALFAAAVDPSVRTAFFPNVTGNTIGAGALDPLDPTNALVGTGFISGGMVVQPGQSIVYHHAGFYYAPLLVSAGPDLSLGLTEPDSANGTDRTTLLCVPTILDDTYDNITNHQGAN